MNKRTSQRYSLSLLIVVLALGAWLCQPDHFSVALRPTASAPTTFTVNSLGDDGCANPNQRNCTLRQVIIAANGNPGLDTIRFQISEGPSLVKTIIPLSELPSITDPVIIDGTTQPGYAGQPLIEISGASAGANAIGLTISAGGSTVKGLAINRFGADGIRLSANGFNTIQSNYLGTDTAGNAALGNGLDGVRVLSSNNLIGGGIPAVRNVISGNGIGVVISANATGNVVRGNYIGTNAAGTARLGNVVGVLISGGARNNMIGGATMGALNVISGNSGNGIVINDSGSTGNKVQGNFIGTDPTGNVALANSLSGVVVNHTNGTLVGGDIEPERNIISGNGGSGISISLGASGCQVRGNFIGTKFNGTSPLGNGSTGVEFIGGGGSVVILNTIAFNGGDGVFVGIGTGNSITENSIFSNNGLGIDLGPNGATPNDAGDLDTGANNLQNFPSLGSARYAGGIMQISGALDTLPGIHKIEFFASASCDPSGNGEGQTLLSSLLLPSGTSNFNTSFPTPPPVGRFITATSSLVAPMVEDPFETSEFSQCIQFVMPGTMQFSSTSYSVNENGGSAAVTVTRAGGSEGPASCSFMTSNGSATAGQDFTDADTVVFFGNGETSKTVFVPITDDSSAESSETVNLRVVMVTGGGTIVAPNTAVLTINDDDSGSGVHFSNTSYTGSEDCAAVTVSVNRIGDTSGVSTVNYSTTSGTASDRADFTAATGTLRFAPGDLQKSFVILVNEDSLTEGTETATITLSNPSGATLGAPSIAMLSILDDSSEPATNANEDSAKFVCQHYHDFLNRQSDSAGQAFWTNEIESCGADAHCREIKRINVSAAFFLSIEFQQTGYLVYRMYKASYGNLPGAPVPLTLQEFLPDTQAIGQGVQVGIGDWQTLLENNKNAFASEFVARTRFTSAFPASMTPAQFVDTLNTNSGGALSPTERNQLVSDLSSGAKTRSQVLRAVAEDQTLAQAEFNKAFVLMQYFGYLRRNPNSVPDSDFAGYNFWLQKLNQFGGNFADAEMVKSFLISGEYRQRFGQ